MKLNLQNSNFFSLPTILTFTSRNFEFLVFFLQKEFKQKTIPIIVCCGKIILFRAASSSIQYKILKNVIAGYTFLIIF
jgi:hypothetical protein